MTAGFRIASQTLQDRNARWQAAICGLRAANPAVSPQWMWHTSHHTCAATLTWILHCLTRSTRWCRTQPANQITTIWARYVPRIAQWRLTCLAAPKVPKSPSGHLLECAPRSSHAARLFFAPGFETVEAVIPVSTRSRVPEAKLPLSRDEVVGDGHSTWSG